jgi:tetratricopeptide (TPR) repeat protein
MSGVSLALVAMLLNASSAPGQIISPGAEQTTTAPAPSQARTGQIETPSPTSLRAALDGAAAALEAGRRAEAAGLYEAAAARYDSVQALLPLARIRSGNGDAAGALDALGRALKLAPNSEEVLSAFAQVSLATRQLVPALVSLDALTRMCPTVASHQYLFGVALMQAGDLISSVEALQRADTLEPDRPLTLIALGLVLNHRKMFSEAAASLTRALELEPTNVEALAALAEAEEGLDQVEAAEARARRALEKAPEHGTANLVMGLVLLRTGRLEEARDHLLRASAADPVSPRPEYQLSLAYARLGDTASSQRHRGEYQRKLREMESRLEQLRSQTGINSSGGMRP